MNGVCRSAAVVEFVKIDIVVGGGQGKSPMHYMITFEAINFDR
jgi:hypothetical protein